MTGENARQLGGMRQAGGGASAAAAWRLCCAVQAVNALHLSLPAMRATKCVPKALACTATICATLGGQGHLLALLVPAQSVMKDLSSGCLQVQVLVVESPLAYRTPQPQANSLHPWDTSTTSKRAQLGYLCS